MDDEPEYEETEWFDPFPMIVYASSRRKIKRMTLSSISEPVRK